MAHLLQTHGRGRRRRQRTHVLLALSSPDCREMYAEYLRRSDCIVTAVADSAAALRSAPSADVVVTDLMLPPSGGTDLVQTIKQSDYGKRLPVIVVSASVFPRDRASAATAGCDAFLPMPCLPSALAREIRRQLLQRTVRRQPARADRTRDTARDDREKNHG
jgi:CheY-like chemotaxis protein